MSLYNLLFGHNAAYLTHLPMLGRKPDEYPRFRDCFYGVEKDGTRAIYIFTRVGSLNQNHGFGEEKLFNDENFLRFEDYVEDATYGFYIFKCPAKWERDFDALALHNFHDLSPDYYEMQCKFWGDDREKVVEAIKRIFENMPRSAQ